jgi:hypothetical protein
MNKEVVNFLIFISICFIAYLLFRNLNLNVNFREGLTNNTDASGNPVSNGIAGNAATYAANIKSNTIQLQDTLLVSKYRSDYETAILNLEELINNMMLQTTLSIDMNNPQQGLTKLNTLSQAKSALNGVMLFLDQSS